MGLVSFKLSGSFDNTERFLKGATRANLRALLKQYGEEGVRALQAATPVDSGKTAEAWGYEVHMNRASVCIKWTNAHVIDGVPVAILIQYGHATRNGGYVQGRDFINPVMRPIFDKIADSVWREVSRS